MNPRLLLFSLLIWAPVLSATPEATETDDDITLSIHGKPVLTYHKAVRMPPEGADPIYQRSGHIHPLRTPSGKVVTGEFPWDHYHQHALFFAWTRTNYQGERIDFWNQRAGTGRVEHLGVVDVESAEGTASMTVKLRHTALPKSGEEIPVLEETWTVTLVDTPEGEPFQFDLVSRQTNISEDPLILDEYHYGGMALRGSDEWIDKEFSAKVKGSDVEVSKEEQPFHFLTSEGKNYFDGNHSRPHWVSLSGPLEGGFGGAALLGHPQNFRFPQPVRLHPHMPYFCFAPMVLGEFEIAPRETYVSAYRGVIHDGPADPELIDAIWESYSGTTVSPDL